MCVCVCVSVSVCVCVCVCVCVGLSMCEVNPALRSVIKSLLHLHAVHHILVPNAVATPTCGCHFLSVIKHPAPLSAAKTSLHSSLFSLLLSFPFLLSCSLLFSSFHLLISSFLSHFRSSPLPSRSISSLTLSLPPFSLPVLSIPLSSRLFHT